MTKDSVVLFEIIQQFQNPTGALIALEQQFAVFVFGYFGKAIFIVIEYSLVAVGEYPCYIGKAMVKSPQYIFRRNIMSAFGNPVADTGKALLCAPSPT